jgi:hypothetical protein
MEIRMATIPQYVSYNFGKSGQLIGARLQNVADPTALNNLASTLGPDNAGLIVYLASDNRPHIWTGSVFTALSAAVTGSVIYRGALRAVDFAILPSNMESGSKYAIAEAGTLNFAQAWNANPMNALQQITITYVPTAVVRPGATLVFEQLGTRSYVAYVSGPNANQASETEMGLLRVATTAQVDAGTDNTAAVTPAKLKGRIDTLKLPRFHVEKVSVYNKNTSQTITHNLNLSDPEAFTHQAFRSGQEVDLIISAIDANSYSFTSAQNFTNLTITTIGW